MRFISTVVTPRSIIRSGTSPAFCGVAMLSSTVCLAAANNLLIAPTSDTNNINGTIGYKFNARTFPSTATITGLGFVDAGENGLAAAHQVGLYHWNGSAYSLERSVTVGAGTASFLDGGYRWFPITDYALLDTSADAYFLAATVTSGEGDLWGGNGSATFTSVRDGSLNAGYNTTAGSQSSSSLPSTWSGSFPGNTFYNAPNATMNAVPVPEPSTCALALAGLAGLGYLVRRPRA